MSEQSSRMHAFRELEQFENKEVTYNASLLIAIERKIKEQFNLFADLQDEEAEFINNRINTAIEKAASGFIYAEPEL